ncbi:MAG: MarR family transcriptional regulator [Alphaproteobacteria bacterium]|jgi:DNA-binding MarR family transcriptional regulator|nr:MarR family transcriptional regulator [Alphaproteobacteria bacterium]MBT5798576.1 MarR family transcriptional regulator [Alphaproteobacteria bacterium]MDC3311318.1 MarR family transcriptional regulator [Alphaproteobacteria bacterium]
MADIKSSQKALFLRKETLRQGIELLFYAYRDFTSEADSILSEIGLGRAHHRVIYFIGRQPGMTVSDLLNILKITKQSLSRVLSHLISESYVRQEIGEADKRQRLLFLTSKGNALEARLTDIQCKRFANAYLQSGASNVAGFEQVLTSLLDAHTNQQQKQKTETN